MSIATLQISVVSFLVDFFSSGASQTLKLRYELIPFGINVFLTEDKFVYHLIGIVGKILLDSGQLRRLLGGQRKISGKVIEYWDASIVSSYLIWKGAHIFNARTVS